MYTVREYECDVRSILGFEVKFNQPGCDRDSKVTQFFLNNDLQCAVAIVKQMQIGKLP